MSGRQYEYEYNASLRSAANRTPVSPLSAQGSMGSLRTAEIAQHYPANNIIAPPRKSVSPIRKNVPLPPPTYLCYQQDQDQDQSSHSPTRYRKQSTTTPGADNYSMQAPGRGITGLATDTADHYPDSGFQNSLRDVDNLFNPRIRSPSPEPMTPPRPPNHRYTQSSSSVTPLMANRSAPAQRTPSPMKREKTRSAMGAGATNASYQQHMPRNAYYNDDGIDEFDPRDFADEDDVFVTPERQDRRSHAGPGDGAAPAMFETFGRRDRSGNYGPVPGGGNPGMRGVGSDPEKSDLFRQEQIERKKRKKWIIIALVLLFLIGGIVGGVVGGLTAKKSSSSSSSHSSAASADNGDLFDINSSQVKQLLNNPALHKVFPGMDYTPLNTQYPDCLTNPPDQNNVTLDIAMLSQLSPAVRLYGTDCNQTEMVLTAIDRLQMNDTMQIWMGVWLGNNQTTNDRQLAQMYDVLDAYPATHFAGVIVGNEVLFRKDLTETELSNVLHEVRQNLTAKGVSLPISTSDLGDSFTESLAAATDIVMANVHPFFAGVTPEVAPGWTWNFWQTKDAILATTKGSYPKSLISETGWPSSGGNDCGTGEACPNDTAGSVANIDNMNTFLDGFVCQAMANSTTYFWFEAFDEPWKVIYNTPDDKWESKWGLMDSNRNVKDGLKIPDCGGKTLSKAY